MTRSKNTLLSAVVGAVLSLPISAQTPPAVPLPDFEALQLSERMLATIAGNPGSILEQAVSRLFQLAPDGQLTQAKIDIYLQRQKARARAQIWAKVLAYDLDGDLVLSAQEIENLGSVLQPGERASMIIMVEQGDTNRDGALSTPEITAYIEQNVRVGRVRWPLGENPMLADLDKDGVVTPEEVSELIRAIAASRPHDPGKPPQKQAIRETVVCGFPKPSGPSIGVFLTAHEGAALSDVAVAGQDKTTTVARVKVQHSARQQYILAGGTTSIIWAFEGSVDRIERVVLRPGDGATGVPADKVTFVDDIKCIPRRGSNNKVVNGSLLATVLRQETGIGGARTHTPYRVGLFDLTRGGELLDLKTMAVAKTPVRRRGKIQVRDGEGFRNATPVEAAVILNERDYRRVFPNGLISLDPKQIVSKTPAERYDILPDRAGIKQLLEDGRLRPDSRRFIITRALPRLPSGIKGPPWVFYMPPGIALPEERSPYLSFRRLSDGKCLGGQNCNDL